MYNALPSFNLLYCVCGVPHSVPVCPTEKVPEKGHRNPQKGQDSSNDNHWSCHLPAAAEPARGPRGVCGRGCGDPGIQPSGSAHTSCEAHGPHRRSQATQAKCEECVICIHSVGCV